MTQSTIRIQAPSEQLLARLNSRVYPICDMCSRPEWCVAEYTVPESYTTWFLGHCADLGIITRRIDGNLSLLQQLAADDLEDR